MTVCAACHAEVPRAERRDATCHRCRGAVLLAGRWRLEALLGEGGTGSTYAADDLDTGESVAVKVLSVSRARSLKAMELFQREGEVLARLSHPGIPRFIATATAEAPGLVSLCLVQERIHGRPVAPGSLDETRITTLLAEVADILAYLHARRPPVIHRDLKPSNVLVREDGSAVLIDFGAVRQATVDPVLGGSTVAGTFGYMAPEQLRGHASPQSDLYGLGALGVTLLAGRDAANLIDPIQPGAWRRAVHASAPLLDLLESLLTPDPSRRPDDAATVARALRALREPPAHLAGAAPATRPSRPEPKRGQRLGGFLGWFVNGLAPANREADAPRKRRRREARPLPPAPASPSAATLDRQLRRIKAIHRRATADRFSLFMAPIILMPFWFWGGAGLHTLSRELELGLGIPHIAVVVLGLTASAVGFVAARRRHARQNHPLLASPLSRALLDTWRGDGRFEPGARAALASARDVSAFSDHDIRAAHKAWAKDLRRIPLLEAEAAYALGDKDYLRAATSLRHALALAVDLLGPKSAIVAEQRGRYAPVIHAAEGFRDEAAALHAEALLRPARPAAWQAEIDALLKKGGGRAGPPPASEADVRSFRRTLWAWSWLPGPGRWVRLFGTAFFSALVGFPLGAVLAAVLAALGAFPEGADAESTLTWFVSTCVLGLAGAQIVAGVLAGPSPVPQDWRSLYPELDTVWPRNHALRPAMLAVLPEVFANPIGARKRASEAVVALERRTGTSDDEWLEKALAGEDPTERTESPLTESQKIHLAELHTLRAWYAEALYRNVDTLIRLPGPMTERRRLLLLVQAARALEQRLPELAARALGAVD